MYLRLIIEKSNSFLYNHVIINKVVRHYFPLVSHSSCARHTKSYRQVQSQHEIACLQFGEFSSVLYEDITDRSDVVVKSKLGSTVFRIGLDSSPVLLIS